MISCLLIAQLLSLFRALSTWTPYKFVIWNIRATLIDTRREMKETGLVGGKWGLVGVEGVWQEAPQESLKPIVNKNAIKNEKGESVFKFFITPRTP